MTIIAASIPVLRALLSTNNPSKANPSVAMTTPATASSQNWREYDALDKDGDGERYRLTEFDGYKYEAPSEASSRAPTAREDWRREGMW